MGMMKLRAIITKLKLQRAMPAVEYSIDIWGDNEKLDVRHGRMLIKLTNNKAEFIALLKRRIENDLRHYQEEMSLQNQPEITNENIESIKNQIAELDIEKGTVEWLIL